VVKLLVTERALTKRLRQTLRAEGKHLRIVTNRKQKKLGLGHYYVADAKGIIDPDVNLWELARNLGVMQSWETLKPKR
jgi:hypothetical protein